MIREITKKLLLLALYALRFADKNATSGLLVLTYHRISEQPDITDPLKISVSMFENQIRFLKTNYFFITADDLRDAITGICKLPDKACLITFDDGWQDNYTIGLPVLKKYNVPALIFISTDYIGSGKIFWHNRLRNILKQVIVENQFIEPIKLYLPGKIAEKIYTLCQLPLKQRGDQINELIECLKEFPLYQIERLIYDLVNFSGVVVEDVDGAMLSWEQVAEMSKCDISFGSHAMSHTILTHLSTEDVWDEIVGSKRFIEKKLHQPIYFMAYPNGNYDERITQIVKEVGMLACFTCKSGINQKLEELFELKRINMRENSASGIINFFSPLFFKIELSGIRFRIKEISSRHHIQSFIAAVARLLR